MDFIPKNDELRAGLLAGFLVNFKGEVKIYEVFMSSNDNNAKNPTAYHRDRQHAIDEVHARPALDIQSPCTVVHITFSCGSYDFVALCEKIDCEVAKAGPRHVIGVIKGIRIKIERHTEFVSCTLVSSADHTEEDLRIIQDYLLLGIEIKIFSICHIVLTTEADIAVLGHTTEKGMLGGVMYEQMWVQTTLQPNDDGIVTYTVRSQQLDPSELGRRVQRLIEVETYRVMALIGLPLARRLAESLTDIEIQLKKIVLCMEKDDGDSSADEEVFNELLSLSEQLGSQRIQTRYRFAASHAYFNIVDARLDILDERPNKHYQTISGFLQSRLEPAQSTIYSVERRLQALTDDITHALTLLRTRIEINIHRSNQALLKSMDQRHKQQLLISQAVEGLSSIAITYYAIGLLSYVFKFLEKAGLVPFSYTALTAASIPITLLLVWWSIHQVSLKWRHKKEKKKEES